jgi:hypothetical protein
MVCNVSKTNLFPPNQKMFQTIPETRDAINTSHSALCTPLCSLEQRNTILFEDICMDAMGVHLSGPVTVSLQRH